MTAWRYVWGAALAGALACGLTAPVHGAHPLSEADLAKLIELRIDDGAIAATLKKEGPGFVLDAAALERLKKAGASDVVLDAARAAASGKTITYGDVLTLVRIGLDEADIVQRLETSPTLFTLDAVQVDELKKAGATETLLAALQTGRSPGVSDPAPTARVTDFAIVLDCSGSMSELTRDGLVKMDVAKRVVADLIAKLPEGLRVTFVIYGYDRALNCEAVKVARPLRALDASGKSELAALIAELRPVGGTPIARALEMTGTELAKNNAACGLVLLSDGKETCGGNPAAVAATLAARLNLTYGVNVIGFDVQDEERDALAAVARAGKGKYFNAQSAAELTAIVRGLQNELKVVAAPPPLGDTIKLNGPRFVNVQAAAIHLPPTERVYLTAVGTGAMAMRVDHVAGVKTFGVTLRIPPSQKAETFDLWWVPAAGRAVKMVSELRVGATPPVVKPEEHLGIVRVSGRGLPATTVVLLTPPGTADFATRSEARQSTDRYGKDMVVAPGKYDLWIEPADGGKTERLAEGLTVQAGRVTVVD